MRACWLKWVGRDWSISADYIWLNYSDANRKRPSRLELLGTLLSAWLHIVLSSTAFKIALSADSLEPATSVLEPY